MSEFARSLAVIIGINNYQNGISKLKTAKPDAERMAQILQEERYGYEVKRFLDEKATSQEIWKYLTTELPQILQQFQSRQTRLLVYFAGHGTPPKGEDGEGGFLLPQDASNQNKEAWLSMQDVLTALKDLNCHHLLVILDCCYAGAMLLDSRRDVGSEEVEELSQERYSRYIKESAWQIITSAAHDQTAIDVLNDNRGISEDDPDHSPFATLLFDALENEAADYTKDGITTATELHLYLYQKLYEQTANQTYPQVSRTWTLPGYDKGEFIFQTGEFDPAKLPEALILNQANNPYRGLKSFDESHSRFFFGRTAVIKSLQEQVSNRSLTIVLGASGSGKSSVVKAGLIPALREESTQQWQILEPIRPGSIPFRALATAVLPLAVEADVLDVRPFQKIHDSLRQARKRSPNDKALNELFAQWRRTSPEEKLLLVVEHFDSLKEWCGHVATVSLQDLRQQGLKLSKLMQWYEASPEKLEKFKEKCTDLEQEEIDRAIQAWSQDVEQWSRDWQKDGKQFGKFIRQHCPSNNSIKPLLVIDQFEELITQCNEADRQQFLAALEAALGACPQLRVVLTLRDDFQYYFEDVDPLKSHWKESCFRVEAMRREQLREAIEGPAQAQVLFFEEILDGKTGTSRSLVDAILDDLGDSPGALPLLSFTLSELYYKYVQSDRSDRTFTQTDYDDLGGVKKALTKRATQEYDDLAKDDEKGQKIAVADAAEMKARQDMCRWVMLRMVADDGDGRAKRRVLEAALDYGDPKNNHRTVVIERFVDARLLVKGKNLEGIRYVEPAHDVLVREWDKISTWLDKTQVASSLTSPQKPWLRLPGMTRKSELTAKAGSFDMTLQRALEVAVREWESRNPTAGLTVQVPMLSQPASSETQNPSSNAEKATQSSAKSANAWLWHNNTRLPLAEEVLKSNDNWLNRNETTFVKKSIDKRDFNTRRNWSIAIGTIIFLAGATFYALSRQREAILNQANSLGQYSSVLSDSHKEFDALIESIRAGRILQNQNATDPVVLAALQKALYGVRERNRLVAHDGEISNIVFSPNAQTFASTRGNIKLWDRNGQLLSTLPERTGAFHNVNGVAFSPDSKMLATARGDNKVEVWDLKGKLLHSISGRSKSETMNVAFSPDGKTITSVANDGTVETWSLGGQLIKSTPGNQDNIRFVSFSSNGKMIITAGWYGDVKLRNSEGQLISSLSDKDNHDTCYFGQNGNHTKCISFSPDSKIIISTDGQRAEFWNTRGERLKIFSKPQARVDSVAFSPDNKTIAFVSNNASVNEIKLYNFEGQLLSTLRGHNSFISCIAFSPDSKTLTSSDGTGIIKIWDVTGKNLPILTGHTDFVMRVIFSHNGHMLASTSYDGTVKLWDRKGTLLHDFSINRGLSIDPKIAFSPDDETIAIGTAITGSRDKERTNTVALWDLKGHRLIPNIKSGTPVYDVAFYDNDTLLSTTGGVILWNRKGRVLHTVGFPHGRARTAAFSPDGETVIGGDGENNVFLWNRKGQLIGKIFENGFSYEKITFSPDSKVFTTTAHAAVTLWNREGQKIKTLPASRGEVWSTFFSPDNRMLATASLDGTVKLWDLKGNLLHTLLGHQVGVGSVAFSPDSKIIASAGDDGLIKLWSREGALLTTLSGHQGKIYSIAFSSDGQTLASGGEDNTVILWNLKDLQLDSLMKNACNWVRSYLQNPNSQDIGKGDKTLCDGV